MPHRPDPLQTADLLPPAAANRLLERASELDAARAVGVPVDELRAAATEAGISGRAFDAALAELRVADRRPAPAAAARRGRRTWRWAVAAVIALVAAGLFAVARTPAPPGGPALPPGEPAAGVADIAEGTQIAVRAAGGGPAATMAVWRDGSLFAGLGVAPSADGRRVGRVALGGTGGTATTPAALEVSGAPGAVTFHALGGSGALEVTLPGATLPVRGSTIRVVRDRAGAPLRAEVVPAPPK